MTLNEAYKLFGITNTADAKTVKQVYHRLVKEWHPDISKKDRQTAEQMTVKINEAYRLLTDVNIQGRPHNTVRAAYQTPAYTHGKSVFDISVVSC